MISKQPRDGGTSPSLTTDCKTRDKRLGLRSMPPRSLEIQILRRSDPTNSKLYVVFPYCMGRRRNWPVRNFRSRKSTEDLVLTPTANFFLSEHQPSMPMALVPCVKIPASMLRSVMQVHCPPQLWPPQHVPHQHHQHHQQQPPPRLHHRGADNQPLLGTFPQDQPPRPGAQPSHAAKNGCASAVVERRQKHQSSPFPLPPSPLVLPLLSSREDAMVGTW